MLLSGGTDADVTGETLRPPEADDYFSIKSEECLLVKEANCNWLAFYGSIELFEVSINCSAELCRFIKWSLLRLISA